MNNVDARAFMIFNTAMQAACAESFPNTRQVTEKVIRMTANIPDTAFIDTKGRLCYYDQKVRDGALEKIIVREATELDRAALVVLDAFDCWE